MNTRNIVELLDNSQDAETIALEIVLHETLHDQISLLWEEVGYNPNIASDSFTLATIIRELWDIAYNHGYYDGKTEAEEGIV